MAAVPVRNRFANAISEAVYRAVQDAINASLPEVGRELWISQRCSKVTIVHLLWNLQQTATLTGETTAHSHGPGINVRTDLSRTSNISQSPSALTQQADVRTGQQVIISFFLVLLYDLKLIWCQSMLLTVIYSYPAVSQSVSDTDSAPSPWWCLLVKL